MYGSYMVVNKPKADAEIVSKAVIQYYKFKGDSNFTSAGDKHTYLSHSPKFFKAKFNKSDVTK